MVKTADIEMAINQHFAPALCVPNVSYGMGLHECDVLVLSKAGYLYEVEIKVSLSDLMADRKKDHGHYAFDGDRVRAKIAAGKQVMAKLDFYDRCDRDKPGIRELWFALPVEILNKIRTKVLNTDDKRWGAENGYYDHRGALIPDRAGVFAYDPKGNAPLTRFCPERGPRIDTRARKLTDAEKFQLARLGALRVWSLKEKLKSIKPAPAGEEM